MTGKRPAEGQRPQQPTATHPRKRFYRARAHSNPFNDNNFHVPPAPDCIDWSEHYPEVFKQHDEAASTAPQAEDQQSAHLEQPLVRFADIGCGFGGLLIKLSPLYPDKLMVGMELRDKVSTYVRDRIVCLRRDHPGQYQNITCIRGNAMKYLPNYFAKGQLEKMFFLFPDPHFKAANHRRRIINTSLLTEYAFVLAPGGWLYTITDVPELGEWMKSKLDAHPMFECISDEELASDPAAGLLAEASEEAQKVARNGGQTFRNVYRRLTAPRDVAMSA